MPRAWVGLGWIEHQNPRCLRGSRTSSSLDRQSGTAQLLNRLHKGSWRIGDVSNIVRLGLIGGGMEPAAALKLTLRYVEERQPTENLIPAQVILSTTVMEAPEEKRGKTQSQQESSSKNSPTES